MIWLDSRRRAALYSERGDPRDLADPERLIRFPARAMELLWNSDNWVHCDSIHDLFLLIKDYLLLLRGLLLGEQLLIVLIVRRIGLCILRIHLQHRSAGGRSARRSSRRRRTSSRGSRLRCGHGRLGDFRGAGHIFSGALALPDGGSREEHFESILKRANTAHGKTVSRSAQSGTNNGDIPCDARSVLREVLQIVMEDVDLVLVAQLFAVQRRLKDLHDSRLHVRARRIHLKPRVRQPQSLVIARLRERNAEHFARLVIPLHLGTQEVCEVDGEKRLSRRICCLECTLIDLTCLLQLALTSVEADKPQNRLDMSRRCGSRKYNERTLKSTTMDNERRAKKRMHE